MENILLEKLLKLIIFHLEFYYFQILNSKIPVIVEPNEVLSILSGTGKENGIIQYSKKYEDIKNDSIIYTSGAGSYLKLEYLLEK